VFAIRDIPKGAINTPPPALCVSPRRTLPRFRQNKAAICENAAQKISAFHARIPLFAAHRSRRLGDGRPVARGLDADAVAGLRAEFELSE
jgi:hypothetical protein